jgi:hypothetical protein
MIRRNFSKSICRMGVIAYSMSPKFGRKALFYSPADSAQMGVDEASIVVLSRAAVTFPLNASCPSVYSSSGEPVYQVGRPEHPGRLGMPDPRRFLREAVR